LETIEKLDQLRTIAKELDCTLAQLSLAWVLDFNKASTVILGASRPEQLEENVKALEVLERMQSARVFDRIDEILNNIPDQGIDFKKGFSKKDKYRKW